MTIPEWSRRMTIDLIGIEAPVITSTVEPLQLRSLAQSWTPMGRPSLRARCAKIPLGNNEVSVVIQFQVPHRARVEKSFPVLLPSARMRDEHSASRKITDTPFQRDIHWMRVSQAKAIPAHVIHRELCRGERPIPVARPSRFGAPRFEHAVGSA